MKKSRVKGLFRQLVLLFFLVLFSIFAMRHYIFGGNIAASVDALCPFGGFETLYTFIATGGFVPRVLMSSLVLAFGVLLSVLVLRKGFCGYICPFGALQELAGKIKKKKIVVPKKIDSYARYIKYIILAAVLAGTAYAGTLVFRNYDPFMSFFHFGKGIFWDYNSAEFTEQLIPFIIMVAVLVLSIYIGRFWCRYLCPLAAVMNIFTRIGATRIVRDREGCNGCRLCDRVCPVDVKISDVDYIRSAECINCNECVVSCPKGSLSLKIFKRRISVYAYVILLLALFFGVIAISMAAGIWQSVPEAIVLADVDGNLIADNIKGWWTIADVAMESGIAAAVIVENVGLPADVDVKLAMNQIGNGFHAESVREFIRNYEVTKEGIRYKQSCPWGIVDDSAPGLCGLYVDDDNDGLCDYSE